MSVDEVLAQFAPVVPGTPRLGACLARVGKFVGIGLNYSEQTVIECRA